MTMVWPIALVVFSNIIYQICEKGVPKDHESNGICCTKWLFYGLSGDHLFCLVL